MRPLPTSLLVAFALAVGSIVTSARGPSEWPQFRGPSQGRIYLLSEDGDTFVLRAGDKYDEIAKNSLGEMSLATPAADADSLYVRTQTKLYRIRNR